MGIVTPPANPSDGNPLGDQTIIEILTECNNPFELIATGQVDPDTWYYDGSLKALMVFSLGRLTHPSL